MTGQTTLGIIFTGINVICAIIYVFAPRRHHHEWNMWGEWTEDSVNRFTGYVQAIRYRTCENCSKVQDQQAGMHRCLEVRCSKHCPHIKDLVGNETVRIKRLEKELGL